MRIILGHVGSPGLIQFNNILVQLNILMLLSSACATDHAPTDAGRACKISSQRTRALLQLNKVSFQAVQYTVEPLYCGHRGDIVKCPV